MALTDKNYLHKAILSLGVDETSGTRKASWKSLIILNNCSNLAINMIMLTSEILLIKDPLALALQMSQAFTIRLSFIKFLCFTRNESKFRDFYRSMHGIRRRYLSGIDFEQGQIKSRFYSETLINFFSICVLLTLIGYTLLPIIVGLYTQYLTDNPDWSLSIKVSEEFVPKKIVPYILAYLWSVYQCSLTAVSAVVVETLIMEYQVNIVTFLTNLQNNFRRLELRRNDAKSYQHFRNLVRFHQEIIELTKKLKELYKPIIFAQFLVTAIAVCVLGFLLLVQYTNYLETVILMIFACAILFQPLIYSYSGERIMEESRNISYAIYESTWYEFNPSDRKVLVLCILRAQKPLKLESPFYKVDLMTFSSIIRATFSYITLLRSVVVGE